MVNSLIRRLLRCRCGHARSAHRHYRRGSDCALCDCGRWTPTLTGAAKREGRAG